MTGYKFYTYIHIRNDIGEVFYVGKGTGRRAFALGRNPYWNSIVAKHGHTVHIVAYFANETDAFEHEKEMIAELREAGFNLANMTDGGEGISGLAPEAREKIRAKSIKRMENPAVREHLSRINMGHAVSEETRAKIGKAGLGRVPSAEARAKISLANKGKTKNLSAEAREKIGAARRGKVVSEETRLKMSASGKSRPPRSAETTAKIAAAHKGKIVSEATRLKMSVTMKGRVLSEKVRAKMRGRIPSDAARLNMSAAQKARTPDSDTTRQRKSAAQINRRAAERQRSEA